ncbi:MAG: TRAP transporter substrate-binding protein [Bacillota bacterium]|nr:TRAP transporter substrate-binding protein [Bacillota bacterium]
MRKKLFKLLALTLVLGLSVLVISGCTNSSDSTSGSEDTEKKVVLSYGGIQSTEDTATKSMQKMAELVKEKSGGSLELQVYPASQLGDAISQIEAVMMGSQDMFIDAASFVAQFVPDKQVDSLFFAFSSEQHFENYLDSDLMISIENQFAEERGVKTLAQNYLRAPRVMVSKTPILSVNDMQGLKMRVPEIRTYLESVNALGANPTQIPWGEVYLALTQGVVEAAEGPLDAVYSMKFYEGAPNITMTNHIRDNLAVLINDKKFNSLSENQQRALLEAATEAGEWYTQQVKDKLDEVVIAMEAEGATIHEVDVKEFVEIMFNAADKLEDEGLWQKGLFENVQKLQ